MKYTKEQWEEIKEKYNKRSNFIFGRISKF